MELKTSSVKIFYQRKGKSTSKQNTTTSKTVGTVAVNSGITRRRSETIETKKNPRRLYFRALGRNMISVLVGEERKER